MTNLEIAVKLEERARELRRRHENLYRIKAYRRAAEMVQRLEQPVEALLQQRGRIALEEVPGIGRRLARMIARYLQTGNWPKNN